MGHEAHCCFHASKSFDPNSRLHARHASINELLDSGAGQAPFWRAGGNVSKMDVVPPRGYVSSHQLSNGGKGHRPAHSLQHIASSCGSKR